jgi:thiosulfate reductase cytochrome b subunit
MKKVYLHPLPVRIWHWVNAVCFFLLIITGIQMRYGGTLSIISFRKALILHNYAAFILIPNFFLWAIYYHVTGKVFSLYIPAKPGEFTLFFRDLIKQSLYYGYGLLVAEPNPHEPTPEKKFNPLQKISYHLVMLLLPVQLVTGFMLWNPYYFSKWINLAGGILTIDTIHVLLTIFYISFTIIHIYFSTLGHTPLAHIKAMFTGYEEDAEED